MRHLINDIICDLYESDDFSISLMDDGGIGKVLCLAYDQYYSNNDHSSKLNNLFSNIDHLLISSEINYDFGSGLTGLGWLVNHLCVNRLIDADFKNFLEDVDEFSFRMASKDLDINNHDFLYGSSGTILYLLERIRQSKTAVPHLEELLYGLLSLSKKSSEGNYWINEHWRGYSRKPRQINYGLAHGQASKIHLLSLIILNGLGKPETKDLLSGCVEFLQNINNLSTESAHTKLGDNSVIFGHSKYAWCNGDLGVASALWHAGDALNDNVLKEEAIGIFNQCSITDEDITRLVPDAGLCHGSMGTALMYKRMYLNTKILKFQDQCEKWTQNTEDFKIFTDGIGGFKKRITNSQREGWQSDSGLLNGASGIALGILSCTSDKDYSWDKLLLL
ncbi:MAG: hypothetical protein IPM74_02125 [Crocinitomicaceae bacterium]|nr:hypothetical protein [Crocinitomicaceae bacterium]MBK8924713.1 hypothetical protein [Crocinitomicaceae bacterium]